MRSLMICIAHPVLCDKIKKNEMGWTCGVYGGGKRRVQGFGGET